MKDFIKKKIRFVVCKVKKEWFYQEKSNLFWKVKKKKERVLVYKKFRSVVGYKIKILLKENTYSWDKFIMHASHIKKKKRL